MRFKLLAAVALATAAAGCGGGDDKPVTPTTAATPAAGKDDPGLKVWVAQACGTCHTLKAGGSTSQIGPDLDSSLEGQTDEYIHESIVTPNAAIAAGFSGGTMPEGFAERIKPDDLTALVAWIAKSVGAKAD